MTMKWSFYYNFFVKFYCKNILEPQHHRVPAICSKLLSKNVNVIQAP